MPDCWIGAGFVRDPIWDALHDRMPDCRLLNDVDVVFSDRADAGAARDRTVEAILAARAPDVPWSVKNQSRMHVRNGVPPYIDTADACARWPESATAVAARWSNGDVELLALRGVDNLLSLIVRPTPAFMGWRDEIARRVATKDWRARWLKLRLIDV